MKTIIIIIVNKIYVFVCLYVCLRKRTELTKGQFEFHNVFSEFLSEFYSAPNDIKDNYILVF